MEDAEKKEQQKMFVGLGNPGKKYEMTRHNMGTLVVGAFAKSCSFPLKDDRNFSAKVAKGRIFDVMVHVMLPQTYMNESGHAVRKYLDFFRLNPRDLVVVSDDVALPFGHMRLRSKGSAGGHNGLKSVESHLGTQDYPRLRVGIGRDHEENQDLSDYVLDRFTGSEVKLLPDILGRGVEILTKLLTQPFEQIMNVVNVKVK